jgi:phosphinothricin acetyltransferase
MNVYFEPMTQLHEKEVIDIFNYYVENTFSAFPEGKLPYEAFAMFLKMTQGYPAYVMKNPSAQNIIGFCFLRPHNPLPVFHETAEITYFIEKDEVGKGLGRIALDRLEEDGRKMGIKNILACISSRNEPSLAFHRKRGFIECGRMKNTGRKNGTTFDEVWMQKVIG